MIKPEKCDHLHLVYHFTVPLTLLGSEKYDAIYDRIRYLVSLKSGITCIFSHYIEKIEVDSYDSLSTEKTNFHKNSHIH